MSETEMSAEGTAIVALPPVLDGEAAEQMQPALLAALAGGRVAIDAGSVQRATTQGLQLLVAAAASFAGQGGEFRIDPCAPALLTAAETLGLATTLGIHGE